MIRWTLVNENGPVIQYNNPFTQIDHSFEIKKAFQMITGRSWKFYPLVGEPIIFILTDKVRYKPWPDTILNTGMIISFLKDNNVEFI